MSRKIICSTLLNGEPWTLKDGYYYEHFCCDCSLVHKLRVDIDKKKNAVTLTFYRDDYATQRDRKWEKVVVRKNGKVLK